MGTLSFTLSQQIEASAAEHGRSWALWHYCINRRGPKLSYFEWRILSRNAV